MITLIRLLRNVGQFESVTQGSALPLSKLTLIYAENGRGKTTLAAILRSFATGDPIPIAERKRLASVHPPHVILECIGGPAAAMFQNNAWNHAAPQVAVFDDAFVAQNVCSGLEIDPAHRQNLHELILGAQGVVLNRQLQVLVARIEEHNRELRLKAEAIPVAARGNLTVDAFCALPEITDIDSRIQLVERQLAAAKQQQAIRSTPAFDEIGLPLLDATALESLLLRDLPDLDAAAGEEVQRHIANIGAAGESWISDGFKRLSTGHTGNCPFCVQDLSGSAMIAHYRAYFSEAYAALKRDIAEAVSAISRTHGEESPAAFERAMRICGERRQFWASFCQLPEVAIDTAEVARTWRAMREAVLGELQAKQSAPLDRRQLSSATITAIDAYHKQCEIVAELNHRLQEAQATIEIVKEQAAAGNVTAIEGDLAHLRAVKAKHTPTIAVACVDYLTEKLAKAATETQRDQAKDALRQYRDSVFPTYQTAINDYLRRFNASFRLGNVAAVDTRGGPTCNYTVVINETAVSISGTIPSGAPSFRTMLSTGDRNTLALAFFFASLDQDASLTDKIVVIDDPITSLDDHRSLTTVQEVRRLVQRTSQVIVLSHSKPFLCRLWEHPDPSVLTAIQVTRDGIGSTLSAWDVNQDCITEHDRRHALLREFMVRSNGNSREVARSIRPIMEAFFRVACPEHFPPGTLLGPFRGICDQRLGTPQQILDHAGIQELRELVEYANRFHHDTNAAWETEVINDSELLGFVQRVLAFTRR